MDWVAAARPVTSPLAHHALDAVEPHLAEQFWGLAPHSARAAPALAARLRLRQVCWRHTASTHDAVGNGCTPSTIERRPTMTDTTLTDTTLSDTTLTDMVTPAHADQRPRRPRMLSVRGVKAALATGVVLVTSVLMPATPAFAASRDGHCDAGEFC